MPEYNRVQKNKKVDKAVKEVAKSKKIWIAK